MVTRIGGGTHGPESKVSGHLAIKLTFCPPTYTISFHFSISNPIQSNPNTYNTILFCHRHQILMATLNKKSRPTYLLPLLNSPMLMLNRVSQKLLLMGKSFCGQTNLQYFIVMLSVASSSLDKSLRVTACIAVYGKSFSSSRKEIVIFQSNKDEKSRKSDKNAIR